MISLFNSLVTFFKFSYIGRGELHVIRIRILCTMIIPPPKVLEKNKIVRELTDLKKGI